MKKTKIKLIDTDISLFSITRSLQSELSLKELVSFAIQLGYGLDDDDDYFDELCKQSKKISEKCKNDYDSEIG